jgi:hypothetical protein
MVFVCEYEKADCVDEGDGLWVRLLKGFGLTVGLLLGSLLGMSRGVLSVESWIVEDVEIVLIRYHCSINSLLIPLFVLLGRIARLGE